MKEMGLSRPKWTSPGWSSLAFGGCHHRRHAACVALRQFDHHCRGAARVTVTCPVDDVRLGPPNGGVTEDWG